MSYPPANPIRKGAFERIIILQNNDYFGNT